MPGSYAAPTNGRLRFSSRDTAFRSITSHLCRWYPRELSSCAPGSDQEKALQEVSKMLQKDAVEPVDQPGPGFYSWLFFVEKVTGGLEARHRFIGVERIRHSDQVTYGDSHVCSWVDSAGELDVLHRPERRVLSDSCPSGISTISPLLSQKCLSVPCLVLRPVHGPAGVYQSLRSSFGAGTSEGHASTPLTGQLAGHCRVRGIFCYSIGTCFFSCERMWGL